jgi:hypothetical protein
VVDLEGEIMEEEVEVGKGASRTQAERIKKCGTSSEALHTSIIWLERL